jgi:hypothetical protein
MERISEKKWEAGILPYFATTWPRDKIQIGDSQNKTTSFLVSLCTYI